MNGTLYDNIAKECETTREKVKNSMLQWFGINRINFDYGILPKIIKMFPHANDTLNYLKRDDYKGATYYCMKMESKIIIDLACTELVRRYPGVFHFTIHDAICAYANLAEEVEEIIKLSSNKANGLAPHLKTELLS